MSFNPDAVDIHVPRKRENGATQEATSCDSTDFLSGMELDKDDSDAERVLTSPQRKTASLQ